MQTALPSQTPPAARPRKRLFTLAEAADYLGRTVYSVRELIWRRELPVIRSGPRGKQWLDLRDLDGWISAHKGLE